MAVGYMKHGDAIFVAGHRGLVGSAISRELARLGYTNLLMRTRQELDLYDPAAVERFFTEFKPQHVILAAARVGGILANDTYPAEFLRENLLIQNNVIESSRQHGVDRLLFLGSSLHLPEAGAAADHGGSVTERTAGADEPSLCAGKDRRGGNVLELQPAIWHQVPCGDADESVRAGR